jgi:hypothetical protein
MMRYEVVDDRTVILATDDACEAYALKNKTNGNLPFNRKALFVRQNLERKSEVIGGSILAYRFWFKNGGYAFYYLDNETGVFQIFSDWGNYAYAWPRHCRSEGESLLDFILHADRYYLTNKLAIGDPHETYAALPLSRLEKYFKEFRHDM